jgi:hypothetical protein
MLQAGTQQSATMAGGPDSYLPSSLAIWLKTAKREIDRHINDRGLCSVCGSSFPCERAVLADLALSAL